MWDIIYPDVLYTLQPNTRHHGLVFDVETLHGSLPEGEYALVKTIGGLGVRYHVLEHFAISDYDYQINVASTNIAPRPLLHKLDTLFEPWVRPQGVEGYAWQPSQF